MSESLADKVIDRLEQAPAKDEPYWGIDELGIPVPKPVNISYVVARVLVQHENIFRIHDKVFVRRKPVQKNSQTLLSLCGRLELAVSPDGNNNDSIEPWAQAKRIINKEHPLVWKRIVELIPVYDRKYIKITDHLAWDKDEADIITI